MKNSSLQAADQIKKYLNKECDAAFTKEELLNLKGEKSRMNYVLFYLNLIY